MADQVLRDPAPRRDGVGEAGEAAVVVEIFERFASGESRLSIAAELNRRGVPSPGSSWNRTQRRAAGWMGNGIRVITRNKRYCGVIHWNMTEWKKNPDTGKRKPVARARSEWITHTDESQRIVSDELWERACKRMKAIAANGHWATTRGAPKYLLSGLLRCAKCGSHYVMADRFEYSRSGFVNGRSCSDTRGRRDRLEHELIEVQVHQELLTPQRSKPMAQEIQDYYAERMRAAQARQVAALNPSVSFLSVWPQAAKQLRKAIAGGIAGDPKIGWRVRAPPDLSLASRQNEREAQSILY